LGVQDVRSTAAASRTAWIWPLRPRPATFDSVVAVGALYFFRSTNRSVWGTTIMFSFDTRKRLCEVREFLRHLVNLTTPNLPPLEGDSRSETRSNRALPALLTPWEHGQPVVDESTYALTKDFSDRGLALVLQQPFKSVEVVVGLYLESPRFVLGEVRQNVPLGGGYWQIGVELTDFLDAAEYPQVQSLVPLAKRLVPSSRAIAT
jgi:hypothetical protein